MWLTQQFAVQVLEMRDSGLTDLALAAVAKGCRQLAYLSMQGPPLRPRRPGGAIQQPLSAAGGITDAGLRAIAAYCTNLKGLAITSESQTQLQKDTRILLTAARFCLFLCLVFQTSTSPAHNGNYRLHRLLRMPGRIACVWS